MIPTHVREQYSVISNPSLHANILASEKLNLELEEFMARGGKINAEVQVLEKEKKPAIGISWRAASDSDIVSEEESVRRIEAANARVREERLTRKKKPKAQAKKSTKVEETSTKVRTRAKVKDPLDVKVHRPKELLELQDWCDQRKGRSATLADMLGNNKTYLSQVFIHSYKLTVRQWLEIERFKPLVDKAIDEAMEQIIKKRIATYRQNKPKKPPTLKVYSIETANRRFNIEAIQTARETKQEFFEGICSLGHGLTQYRMLSNTGRCVKCLKIRSQNPVKQALIEIQNQLSLGRAA